MLHGRNEHTEGKKTTQASGDVFVGQLDRFAPLQSWFDTTKLQHAELNFLHHVVPPYILGFPCTFIFSMAEK